MRWKVGRGIGVILVALTLAACMGLWQRPEPRPRVVDAPGRYVTKMPLIGATVTPFAPPLHTPAVQETPEPSPTPPTTPGNTPTPMMAVPTGMTPAPEPDADEEELPDAATPTPEADADEEELPDAATPTPEADADEEELPDAATPTPENDPTNNMQEEES